MRKKITFSIVFCIAVISLISFAEAAGRFIELRIFNKTTGYFDTPAEMLITDSQGRRTGYSSGAPFNKAEQLNMFNEIPEGMYVQEGIGSASNENPHAADDSGLSNFRRLLMQEADQGDYTLQIIGRKTGEYSLNGTIEKNNGTLQFLEESQGFIVQGQTTTVIINYDPTPGTPALIITKAVTFDALHNDISVAKQLNQLGDDNFVRSLAKNIYLAEKLSAMCDKLRHGKGRSCQPAIAVLNMLVKRLETANRKCDSKDSRLCDEENDWNDFGKSYRKDHDYDDFFREWDRDDWHKDKKTCKRFVTDEALKIISEDVQWLIKSLGGEIKDEHKDKKEKHGKDDK
jgi:hypothetical protein